MDGLYTTMKYLGASGIAAIALFGLAGCQATMKAPMYCWAPAELEATVGRRVALAKIAGAEESSAKLEEAFISNQPAAETGAPLLVSQSELQRYSTIKLASASQHEPSDMALLHAARYQNIDYLLSGEVLERRGSNASEDEAFSVSWRLTDVRNNQLVGGFPVTVTKEDIRNRYPALENRPDKQQALIEAAAVESWHLLTPHLEKREVTLAKPKWSWGARQVREGNHFAASGNWHAAEQVWLSVERRYPKQHAATHNLALAAAARQDFASARQLAQKAFKANRKMLYRTTPIWIEARQIELADAFNLDPPESGWSYAPDDVQRQR